MDNVKSYILSQLASKHISKEQAKTMLLEITSNQYGLSQDIAVIGLAGRFAEAKNIVEFWEFLKVKKSGIRDFPQGRKDDLYQILKNPYYTEFMLGNSIDEKDFDNMFSKSGYLDQIDKFDAQFFGIPPLEADYMDPNQRIALEVAWEAIENAGYGGDCLKGTKTGVYLGRDYSNYSYYRMCSEKNSMQLSGSWEGMVASRISYLLDLKGPCMMTDTACSAGMVSVHLAIQSLLMGECDIAMAGGINLSSIGEPKSSFLSGATMSNVESDDSIIRTFDGRANGTLWGEGVGVVLLKPLKKAIEDGDSIRAVIKATAINNDGTSNSITAPNALTQEQVILNAWKKASIDPETISYVEAHGTGTVLGDPIEIKGLTNAFRRYTNKKQFCGIGSLKTNMGHMVAASGIASMAKVIKSLESKTLVPISNFEVPNPYINFSDSPFYVNDELIPWEAEAGVRRAAINSFGFIRTNCHMVLEEGNLYKASEQKKEKYCLTISAKCEKALVEYVDKYLQFIETSEWSLPDICFTSNIGRGHYGYRMALIISTKEQLHDKLQYIKENGLCNAEELGIHYDYHNLVNDKKKMLEKGDITAKMKKSITDKVLGNLVDYISQNNARALVNVVRYYVQGAEVDWTVFYKGEKCKRVQIPTYPLQKTRHWAKPMLTGVKRMNDQVLHPLVQKEVKNDGKEIIFESKLSVDTDWVLSDHRISNKSVVPGTTYLEMIRYAISKVTNSTQMELKNVFFLLPLSVEDTETKTVHIELAMSDACYKFKVLSLEDEQWSTHVEGDVEVLSQNETIKSFNIEAYKNNAKDKIENFVGESDTGVFQFGKHWDVVRAVWQNEATTLARLELPNEYMNELQVLRLHPSILDNAVNLISQNSENTYLPYMYKSLRLYGNMPEQIYSYIKVKEDKNNRGETITYDVDLMDNQGKVFAQIFDYTIKKIDLNSFHTGLVKKYLNVDWIRYESREWNKNVDSKWAVILCNSEEGTKLAETFEAENIEHVPYYLGEDTNNKSYTADSDGILKIIDDISKKNIQGVLWATDYTADLSMDNESRRKYGVNALFTFFKCMIQSRVKLSEGLKIVVKNAWKVNGKEKYIDPFSAASASIAKVMSREYAGMTWDIIDAQADMPESDVIRECIYKHTSLARVVRTTGTYAKYLEYCPVKNQESYEYDKQGTYIISGGMGGIGFSIAQKLSALNVKKVILLGRTKLSDDAKNKVASLGNAEYVRCDVSKEEDVIRLSEYLEESGDVCAGVFHAAGISGDGFLMNKSHTYFNEVVTPKIEGSLNLSNIVKTYKGAFLVMFSSITSITGEEGQGDYCCANAFMDSLACKLVDEGINAIAINWPSWEKVGMAARYRISTEDSLFNTMPVEQGLEWLDYLIENRESSVIPSEFNMKLLVQYKEELPFLISASITEEIKNAERKENKAENEKSNLKIKGTINPSDIEIKVANMFANVLGLEEIDIYTGFQEMGGNSLMTTQLLKQINAEYPDVVDIADLFSYSSVSELSAYIREKTGIEEELILSEDAIEEKNTHQVLMEVLGELGDKDLMDMFMEDGSVGDK